MMKARRYNRRILDSNTKCNVRSIIESNGFDENCLIQLDDSRLIAKKIIDDFWDAKEYGTIIQISVTEKELDILEEKLNSLETKTEYENLVDILYTRQLLGGIRPLVNQARMMIAKYHVVDTNPPYMNKYDSKLKKYVLDNYKDYSGDLFSVFIYRNTEFCMSDGYAGFMTPYVWMFIQSYEALRRNILDTKSISSLIQMEYSAFEEATVPICSFVLKNGSSKCGTFIRLTDFKGGMKVQREKFLEGIADSNCRYIYEINQSVFYNLPGAQIAYWIGEKAIQCFGETVIGDFEAPKAGLSTGDNERFLRLYWEVIKSKIYFDGKSRNDLRLTNKKWVPMTKGGDFRRWYGNNHYVLNFEKDGEELKYWLTHNPRDPKTTSYSRYIRNYENYLQEGFSFNDVSSSKISFRYQTNGFIPNARGPFLYKNDMCLLGYLNSKVCAFFLSILSPTLTFNVGDVSKAPYIEIHDENVKALVEENIEISRYDWDTQEISWDFKKNPLI